MGGSQPPGTGEPAVTRGTQAQAPSHPVPGHSRRWQEGRSPAPPQDLDMNQQGGPGFDIPVTPSPQISQPGWRQQGGTFSQNPGQRCRRPCPPACVLTHPPGQRGPLPAGGSRQTWPRGALQLSWNSDETAGGRQPSGGQQAGSQAPSASARCWVVTGSGRGQSLDEGHCPGPRGPGAAGLRCDTSCVPPTPDPLPSEPGGVATRTLVRMPCPVSSLSAPSPWLKPPGDPCAPGETPRTPPADG